MENSSSTERTARILASLDGIKQAAAPDFFYTRLQGKMQGKAEEMPFFLLRPAFITAALSIFLMVNVYSLLEMKKTSGQQSTIQTGKQSAIESFAKAYDLNTGSVYE